MVSSGQYSSQTPGDRLDQGMLAIMGMALSRLQSTAGRGACHAIIHAGGWCLAGYGKDRKGGSLKRLPTERMSSQRLLSSDRV